ncbi:unnamed protein product [Symbiodinium natans]|uniref:Uncharacterized protein n=1 Tax=Symbiodinium natans TaxID=878477 RepID=A0A812TYB7_9DINO|nr:unnamed protein product [Symbiodinium natans]
MDAVLRDRIEASLRSKDSDSMIFGFRQMLKGICDGALLLDSSLQINGSAVCLQRLLSVREDLAGHSLEDFIDGEPAKDRFRCLESCVEGGNMDTEERAPPCLRVPFRAPSGRVVSADVCYVRLPNLYGAKSLHYLLSLTEDVDPRAIPEVEQLQTDQAPQERHFQHPGGQCAQARAEPASVASSESHVPYTPRLLNLSSELVDVEEAHLRFERHTNEVGFRMGMPTLKRFARPLEWRYLVLRSSLYTFSGC